MPKRTKTQKSNGPLNKITSTMKRDYDSIKDAYQAYRGGRFGAADAFDSGLKELGRGSYGKGGAKLGGYIAGGALIFDSLFD